MNILEKIKDTEKQAAEIRQKGAADAREYAREAQAAREKAAEELLSKAKAETSAALKKAGVAAEKEAAAYIECAQADDAARVDAASSKLNAAVERIVKEVRGV